MTRPSRANPSRDGDAKPGIFVRSATRIARELIGESGDQDDAETWAFARAIIALGRSLGLPIVAEGIETQAQLRVLRQLGCGMGQGFLFGRPASADVIGPRIAEAMLEKVTA